MPITNSDTQTSPGIGPLPDAFSVMGGCIVDLVGVSGARATAQISASTMFRGWVPGSASWLIVGTTEFNSEAMSAALGGGLTKANIRITLYDGDSGSPNPVYVAMFGSGHFPYARSTPQPGDYDFDGGTNLYVGFQDADGNPVNCGYMGECTTYRLDADGATIDTFTGFPGTFALTDPRVVGTRPPEYLNPVQTGAHEGIWPVTGWFSVPTESLSALYAVIANGRVQVGVHDISPGDQYLDFTQGLAEDVVQIPFGPTVSSGNRSWLDLWVWRQLKKAESLDENLDLPPGAMRALLYCLACELYDNYPAAAEKYKFEELLADRDEALREYEALNAANAVAEEPIV